MSCVFFFFKQKTAYEMRISDWSSDVCSSDLDGAPAAKAGLKRGDIVTKVGGKDVTPQQSLSYLIANVKPGARVPLEIIREGKTTTLNVTVGTRPPEEELNGSNFDPEAEQTLPDEPSAGAAQAIQEQLGMAVQPHTADLTPPLRRHTGTQA